MSELKKCKNLHTNYIGPMQTIDKEKRIPQRTLLNLSSRCFSNCQSATNIRNVAQHFPKLSTLFQTINRTTVSARVCISPLLCNAELNHAVEKYPPALESLSQTQIDSRQRSFRIRCCAAGNDRCAVVNDDDEEEDQGKTRGTKPGQ